MSLAEPCRDWPPQASLICGLYWNGYALALAVTSDEQMRRPTPLAILSDRAGSQEHLQDLTGRNAVSGHFILILVVENKVVDLNA